MQGRVVTRAPYRVVYHLRAPEQPRRRPGGDAAAVPRRAPRAVSRRRAQGRTQPGTVASCVGVQGAPGTALAHASPFRTGPRAHWGPTAASAARTADGSSLRSGGTAPA